MKNRLAYLDVLRLLAVVLVMFGHYISVGGGATEIPGIIDPDFLLPLYDATKWQLWKFEIFMIEQFSTQTAILGVSLFFIVTGYLIPMMMQRYTRQEFLLNRFFRIFPTLFVAVIVLGLFIWTTQGITFRPSSYFASWTLSYLVFGVVPIAGILWTLVIEVLFYICAAAIGRFSTYKLFILQSTLLVIILASIKRPDAFFLMIVATQSKYLLMICVGSAIYLAEKEINWQHKFALVFSSFVLAYLGFQMHRAVNDDTSTYNNLGTHALALAFFLFFYLVSRFDFLHKLPKVMYWLADLVYPIYLLHTAIGLGTMALVRGITDEPYLMLVAAIISTIFISWLLNKYVEEPGIALGRLYMQRINAGRVNS